MPTEMSLVMDRVEVKKTTAAARPASHLGLYALLAIMLLCWSANFIFAKIALREFPSTLVVCLRTLIAGVAIVPIYFFGRERWNWGGHAWTRRDVPRLLSLGILGLVGNQVVFVFAVSQTSVAHCSLLCALVPIFVLVGATWMKQEEITHRKLSGMLIAITGVGVVQLGTTASGQSSLLGDFLMLISCIIFAAFTVLGKSPASEFGPLTINFFAFVGGAVLLLPYSIWCLARLDVAHISTAAWISIVFMGIFPSIVGYLIYAYALRHLPASRVSSVSYLQPVLATILAILFLNERPGLAFVAGAILVLGGVWFTQTRASKG